MCALTTANGTVCLAPGRIRSGIRLNKIEHVLKEEKLTRSYIDQIANQTRPEMAAIRVERENHANDKVD